MTSIAKFVLWIHLYRIEQSFALLQIILFGHLLVPDCPLLEIYGHHFPLPLCGHKHLLTIDINLY